MNVTRRGFLQTAAAVSASLAATRHSLFASPTGDDLAAFTLAQASARIRSGAVTPSQLTAACIDRIRIYNPKLEAFITVLAEQAMSHARLLDQEQKAGKLRSPLHGIPIAIKDNMDTAGIRTTGGSAVLDDHVPLENATVVERLLKAGAVMIGKTNMSEFAFGVSYFGSVRNPWALDRDTGGSSSGSAVAVASTLCYGALGTDTGCSIRMPAAWCGVLGFKPTYGLVPLRGILPDVPSYAHCGPLARGTEDIALLLNQVAGYDRLDVTSANHPREDYAAGMKQPVDSLRVGIARAPYFDHLDADMQIVVEEAIREISKHVHSLQDVMLPSTKEQNVDTNAELYVYHQELYQHYADQYMLSTRQGIEAVRSGLNQPPGGCGAVVTNYIRARANLDLLRRTIDDAFTDVDLVLLPSMRHIPRTINESNRLAESLTPHNPEGDLLRDCTENNLAFDAYGIPALTVPCGFSRQGLPVGLMITGPNFSESRVLALSRVYEQATSWASRRPPLQPNTIAPPVTIEQDPR
jgi:aspartyl-tRNA(Asn)/glutamyl-tRNA(Gln) amidotransferase subunit A